MDPAENRGTYSDPDGKSIHYRSNRLPWAAFGGAVVGEGSWGASACAARAVDRIGGGGRGRAQQLDFLGECPWIRHFGASGGYTEAGALEGQAIRGCG